MAVPRTPAEWDAEPDLFRLVKCYRGEAWFRQLRLFAACSCRRIWDLIPPGACREAIEAAEQYAHGKMTLKQLDEAGRRARGVVDAASQTDSDARVHGSLEETIALAAWACTLRAERPALEATGQVLGVTVRRRFDETLRSGGTWAQANRDSKLAYDSEMAVLVSMLREMVGNPFRVESHG